MFNAQLTITVNEMEMDEQNKTKEMLKKYLNNLTLPHPPLRSWN